MPGGAASDWQAGSAGLGFSQPQGTRARRQGTWAQPGSASVFSVSWNEPFNASGLIYWGGGNFDRVF